MESRRNKIMQLKEMGWSKSDIAELLQELVDALFEDEVISFVKSDEANVVDILKSWGFSLRNVGTQYLIEAILYCMKKNSANILLRKDLYLFIQEKYNVKYEHVRWNMRAAIYSAFKNPTESAKVIFRVSIQKRGYPTIKEFIVEAYEYIHMMLSTVEEEK